MTSLEIGKKYVAMCKEGRFDDCITSLFSKDAVSVEAAAEPGQDRTAKGIEAIREKGKWWADHNTVHKAEVSGPYPHDNRFAVRFVFEVTNKQTGKRTTMDEVGLFTVGNDKITREEFFYPTS
jgi:hypothetical protein